MSQEINTQLFERVAKMIDENEALERVSSYYIRNNMLEELEELVSSHERNYARFRFLNLPSPEEIGRHEREYLSGLHENQ